MGKKMTVVVAGISNRRIEEITGLPRVKAQEYLAVHATTLREAMEECGKKVAATLWELDNKKKKKGKEVVADEQSEEA